MANKNAIKELFDTIANSSAVLKARRFVVAQRIKGLRFEHRYTHEEVAKGTNINLATYSNYENAYSNTPIESLVRLAIFYDVSLDYICGRTENKKGCYHNTEHCEDNDRLAEMMKRIEEMEKRIK